jgi:hypothetical protein
LVALEIRGVARRDRDTDTELAAAGWLAVRIWEHEDPVEAAAPSSNSCASEPHQEVIGAASAAHPIVACPRC